VWGVHVIGSHSPQNFLSKVLVSVKFYFEQILKQFQHDRREKLPQWKNF